MPEATNIRINFTVKSPSDKTYQLPNARVWPMPPARVNKLRLRTRLRILAGWPLAVAMKLVKATLPPAAGRRP